jgi:hypothetical protein
VAQHEGFAALAPNAQYCLCGAPLFGIALLFLGQGFEQGVTLEPELRVRLGVLLKVPGDLRPRGRP